MNLLVTNAQYPQAYAVIRALRPHANRIVATLEGEGRLRDRLSHGANSRYVDKRYPVPSPVGDWWGARIRSENTEREAAYIGALVRICEAEKIDVIFPSWDPYVYVLSKNRELLARMGIVIPVPDHETVLTALDKYRTVRMAEEVGFPAPRTYLYESDEDLKRIAGREGFPLVVKPRFTSGGRGMAIARNFDELQSKLPPVLESHGKPMIQEYIPGGERGSVQFVLDRDGRVRFAFRKTRHRKFRVTARYGTVSESALPDARVLDTARLVQRLGWWGAMGIETIVDPRDGLHKLMEINPRFPRQLWNRTELGINEPWMCLQIARGEEVETVEDYPLGVLFVSPVEDLQLLGLQLLDRLVYTVRVGIRGRSPIDRLNPPMPAWEQIRSFLETYTNGRRKVFDPYFRHFFQDPVVSLLWWLQFATWMWGARKQLGK